MRVQKLVNTRGVIVPSSRKKPDPTTFLGNEKVKEKTERLELFKKVEGEK